MFGRTNRLVREHPGFTNTLLTCALIIGSATTNRPMISAPDIPRDPHQHLRLPGPRHRCSSP
ncbi:hypothetical protein [Streptomyces canus]|uniref:hypothetical protein n=1 Tax=Streptomyces canus TaxID=58343 RepID=UPI003D9A6B7C